MSEQIKETDIMMGNRFSHTNENGTFNIQVEEIRPTGIITTWNGGSWFVSYDKLKGIPLTEDILLKSGFKKDVNGILWIKITPDKHFELIYSDKYYYPQLAQSPEMSFEKINVVSLNRISALHQIQNLFFIISGTDLKIEI